MPNPRIFQVSDELVQGFTTTIDLDYYDSNEEICCQMKKILIGFLEHYNMEALITKAKESQLHIHDVNFGQILLSESPAKFWVCGHCTMESTPPPAPVPTAGSTPVSMSVPNNLGENLML